MQGALTELGHTPFQRDFHPGETPENELERVQIDNDLKVDGRATPGGPTERALNNELLRKRDEDKRTLGGLLSDPRVRKPVGMAEIGKSNTVRDLKRTEDALTRIGRPPRNEHRPTGLMRADAVGKSLMEVQSAAGLERDGVMNPGGPTERELMRELDRKDQLAPPPVHDLSAVKDPNSEYRRIKGRDFQIAEGGLDGTSPSVGASVPNPIRRVHAPTRSKIRVQVLGRALAFDPNGKSEAEFALINPVAMVAINSASAEAKKSTFVLFGRGTPAGNNAADAFRHAVWSYKMTRKIGPHLAKSFGDAHEISSPNTPGARLMDLYNNNVGRRLALDPANKNRDPDDVVLEALRRGELQVVPFRTH